MMFPLVAFLVYSFFIAVAAGMAIPRDDELNVGPVLHATRLTPGEYLWGKFGAVLLLFLVVMTAHLLLTILFNQVIPSASADQIRGPFSLTNYLRPALVLALPFVVFLCGASFAIGERTRKPILVFVTPVALFLVSIFFLWDWSPSWLDPSWNRLLMWIEPSGFRWINETWLKVDLGVDYYNQQPITYDLPFLLSRLVYIVLGLGMVASSTRPFHRDGARPAVGGCGRLVEAQEERDAGRRRAAGRDRDLVDAGLLASLEMTSSAPGFVRAVWDVARFEARSLRVQPGLYIFVPLILLQTIGEYLLPAGRVRYTAAVDPGNGGGRIDEHADDAGRLSDPFLHGRIADS